ELHRRPRRAHPRRSRRGGRRRPCPQRARARRVHRRARGAPRGAHGGDPAGGTRMNTMTGVEIRSVESVAELHQVVGLFAEVWGLERGDELVTVSLLRAMTHAGHYVAAAFEDGR